MAPTDVSRHTLSVLVEDVEGILSRVTGMFSRRGIASFPWFPPKRKIRVSTG